MLSDGLCPQVRCVAQATHAVSAFGNRADRLCGRERVRCLWATHPTLDSAWAGWETGRLKAQLRRSQKNKIRFSDGLCP
ncbi:nitric oxide dioxygenase [Neisseria bacilliformis ATCC BAA-1200]|uniref:Nitric oxide dioxygenase n=1 Tax=Neisseria bacilliformis ATCC BAA-1200 TaxID=888742 RepID=F2BFP4_9NEIS|nr:nitric oxide dioxygenase [Neisseria bacilliformis ATCC BAA-1200]